MIRFGLELLLQHWNYFNCIDFCIGILASKQRYSKFITPNDNYATKILYFLNFTYFTFLTYP